MTTIKELTYGAHSKVRFDDASETAFTSCLTSKEPVADTRAAVAAALENPVEFPPFVRALAPGDKVVLAVERDVPQIDTISEEIVRLLTHAGIELADITILRSPELLGDSEDPIADTPKQTAGATVAVHNPDDRGGLAYLAAAPDGEPIYMNRLLCEADVVLPISCARLAPARRVQLDGGLYPAFSDTKAQQPRPAAGKSAGKKRVKPSPKAPKDAPDVGWMLGIQCILQVVPGPGDSVIRVLAGDPASVTRMGRQMCEQAWSFAVPERASLVVAAIEGDASQQTWRHVARAITAAAEAVADDGSIAVCCDLATNPGPAVQALAESDDPVATVRRLKKSRPPDLEIATRLARAMQRAKLYLLSNLDESVVEDLGIAPVGSADEIVRLAGRHKSCILLSNAQHAVATPPADE